MRVVLEPSQQNNVVAHHPYPLLDPQLFESEGKEEEEESNPDSLPASLSQMVLSFST